ncbi:MAG: hypothetical protein WBA45_04960 [Microthrixaceae bacterium]
MATNRHDSRFDDGPQHVPDHALGSDSHELEDSAGVSQRAVGDALGGARHYDDLTDYEQAAVRAEWVDRIAERRDTINIAAALNAEGRPYATIDDDGNLVIHNSEPGLPGFRM